MKPRVQEVPLIIKHLSTQNIYQYKRAEVALEFLCRSGLQVPLVSEGWQGDLSGICFLIYAFKGQMMRESI